MPIKLHSQHRDLYMFKNKSISWILLTLFAAGVHAEQPALAVPSPTLSSPAAGAPRPVEAPAALAQNGKDGFQTSAPAISVDDLLRSGQLGRIDANKRPNAVPFSAHPQVLAPYPGGVYPSNLGAAIVSSEPVLLSIFKFAGNTQAQIETGRTQRIVSAGDRLKDGWIIKAISADSISIEKCEKKCKTKKLHLGED